MENTCRDGFIEAVEELIALGVNPDEHEQVIWKAEYLTHRDRWLHFYGIIKSNEGYSIAHEYDLTTRTSRSVSPRIAFFDLLGFASNEDVRIYLGDRTISTDVLSELASSEEQDPEVVRIGIESRSRLLDGRSVTSVTDVIFVGLAWASPLPLQNTARTFGQVSRKWCRNRMFVGPASRKFEVSI
ncbi:hypothetical protein E2F50_22200 [Rhizobium deserti]|uniref:Uncharacterized protein n=1 Tax=Rhizobium deserti TaxID=2547961 RepID=A0A4R5U7G3_9HYPH|nr:hypothetical protein [Rhizobium deserti]TDK29907.1 hypothetical protein E2F50_22200 [Rhizobium deserti]